MTEKIIGGLLLFLGFLVLILIIGALISFPFMWLWNVCLVPYIPAILPIAHWYHAWGILIVAAFLFKGSSVSSK